MTSCRIWRQFAGWTNIDSVPVSVSVSTQYSFNICSWLGTDLGAHCSWATVIGLHQKPKKGVLSKRVSCWIRWQWFFGWMNKDSVSVSVWAWDSSMQRVTMCEVQSACSWCMLLLALSVAGHELYVYFWKACCQQGDSECFGLLHSLTSLHYSCIYTINT